MKPTRKRRAVIRPGEVADRLGVTIETVRAWSEPGCVLADAMIRLPGRQRRYVAAKIDALVKAGRAA